MNCGRNHQAQFSRSPNPQNDLFSSYNRSASPSKSKRKPAPRSPFAAPQNTPSYGYPASASADALAPGGNAGAFGAYPGSSGANAYAGGSSGGYGMGANGGGGYAMNGGAGGEGGVGYRSATPNSRGQYSAQALEEMESQTEENFGVLTGKVRMLKDLTVAIGDEIRTSSSLAEKMNDQFENSRLKIRGTMNRMLRMAQKTGVGWKVWVGFFAAVIVLFWYVVGGRGHGMACTGTKKMWHETLLGGIDAGAFLGGAF
ncbi:hypothetical protein CC80DRAFT_532113 [Byssothecium circinans]|uniref:t-SNARE coiled-coil homology domain-containing protein n=1 Tax=Byssothecium circinans TaxID=147558 RepID=A0A6A5UAZ7_9PLEO|nr:hypothetical protein CC80DRAFT_532113 [Byssothecium circinans]